MRIGITCYQAAKEMDMAANQVAARMLELRRDKRRSSANQAQAHDDAWK